MPLSIKNLHRKIELLEDAVNSLIEAQKTHKDLDFRALTLKAQEDLYFCKTNYENLAFFIKPPATKQKRFLGSFLGGLIRYLI